MRGKLICLGLLMCSAAVAQEKAPFTVHRYAAMEDAWYVNAFWIESKEGIVLIDTLMLKDDIKHLTAMMKATGKPLAGVIITHSHPDHYSGISILRESFGDFPVYATKETVETMPEAEKKFRNGMAQTFGDRVPEKMVLPDKRLDSPTTITLAGIPLEIRSLGPGEGGDNAIIYQKDLNVVFTGDIVMTNSQQWLGESHSEESLAQLDYLRKHHGTAKYFYPGHGDPCTVSQLQVLETYIHAVRKAAKKLLVKEGELKRQDFMEAGQALVKDFPHLLSFGFDPVMIAAGNINGVLIEMKTKKDDT